MIEENYINPLHITLYCSVALPVYFMKTDEITPIRTWGRVPLLNFTPKTRRYADKVILESKKATIRIYF